MEVCLCRDIKNSDMLLVGLLMGVCLCRDMSTAVIFTAIK